LPWVGVSENWWAIGLKIQVKAPCSVLLGSAQNGLLNINNLIDAYAGEVS
jgi:hypothetical protein